VDYGNVQNDIIMFILLTLRIRSKLLSSEQREGLYRRGRKLGFQKQLIINLYDWNKYLQSTYTTYQKITRLYRGLRKPRKNSRIFNLCTAKGNQEGNKYIINNNRNYPIYNN